MKKLMIIAGAMLLAVAANAAAVSWNTGAFSAGFAGPDGKTLANSELYTLTVSFYSDAAGKTLVTTSTQTKAKGNGAYNSKTADVFDNGTTYYVSAILKANDGSSQLTMDTVSFTLGDTGDSTINFTTGAGFDTTSQKWASSGWQSVPEPTSGLLMLLGMAGLALRRKRA